MSFSYKKGVPVDSTEHGGGYVFDCRCLDNPGREERFKTMTGKDKGVIEFLEKNPEVDVFYKHIEGLVDASVKKYSARGFAHLSVSFGCTGGQHRSVYLAERLAKHLKNTVNVELKHREFPDL